MGKYLTAATLVGCLAIQSQGSAQDKGAKTDKDKLQGTWVAVSAEAGGMKFDFPKDMQTVFTFSGDKLTLKDMGKKEETGTFKIDEKKNPKEIDMTTPKVENPKETETVKGIYQLDGDTLKIAFRADPAADRPNAFDAKGAIAITFKRK
jgi:uncharacterized protein (TIGR03067 family)